MEENRELDHVAAAQPQLRRRLPLWAKLSIGGLVIVVAFCTGLVATLIVPSGMGKLVMPNRVKAKADIYAIADALNSYAVEHDGRFPETLTDLVVEQKGRYLDIDTLPLDPWRRPYRYEPPEPGGKTFRVFSLGKDGQPGGEGEDQDIDNLLIKGKI